MVTRREALRTVGGASLLGLSGCSGVFGGRSTGDLPSVAPATDAFVDDRSARWRVGIDDTESPIRLGAETLYILDGDTIRALDPQEGDQQWATRLADTGRVLDVLERGGRLYAVAMPVAADTPRRVVQVIDRRTGEHRGRTGLGLPSERAPAVETFRPGGGGVAVTSGWTTAVFDGTTVRWRDREATVGVLDGDPITRSERAVARRSGDDGSDVWRLSTLAHLEGVYVGSDRVYAASEDGDGGSLLRVLDGSTGDLVWETTFPTTPTVAPVGRAGPFVGAEEFTMLDRNGEVEWRRTADELHVDGHAVPVTTDGHVFGVRVGNTTYFRGFDRETGALDVSLSYLLLGFYRRSGEVVYAAGGRDCCGIRPSSGGCVQQLSCNHDSRIVAMNTGWDRLFLALGSLNHGAGQGVDGLYVFGTAGHGSGDGPDDTS